MILRIVFARLQSGNVTVIRDLCIPSYDSMGVYKLQTYFLKVLNFAWRKAKKIMRREGQGRGHEAFQAGGTRCQLQTSGGTPSLVSTATEAQAPGLLTEQREKHDSKMHH